MKPIIAISDAIQRGILQPGASEYLETLEQAKRQLLPNQILYVLSEVFPVNPDGGGKTIILANSDENYKTIGGQTLLAQLLGDPTIITELYIPEGVEIIDAYAFAGCINLEKNWVLPSTLKTIREYAFQNCGTQNNIDITIPDTVEQIEAKAFEDVHHITYHGAATGAPWGALSMN